MKRLATGGMCGVIREVQSKKNRRGLTSFEENDTVTQRQRRTKKDEGGNLRDLTGHNGAPSNGAGKRGRLETDPEKSTDGMSHLIEKSPDHSKEKRKKGA